MYCSLYPYKGQSHLSYFDRISIQVYPYVWILLVSTVMNIRLTPIFAVSFHYLFIDSNERKKSYWTRGGTRTHSPHLQSKDTIHLLLHISWQLGRGSNSHALQHRSQSPACLSIPPPSYNSIS